MDQDPNSFATNSQIIALQKENAELKKQLQRSSDSLVEYTVMTSKLRTRIAILNAMVTAVGQVDDYEYRNIRND